MKPFSLPYKKSKVDLRHIRKGNIFQVRMSQPNSCVRYYYLLSIETMHSNLFPLEDFNRTFGYSYSNLEGCWIDHTIDESALLYNPGRVWIPRKEKVDKIFSKLLIARLSGEVNLEQVHHNPSLRNFDDHRQKAW